MNYTEIHTTYKELPVSSQQAFPAAPYPRKYIHCVIDDLYNMVQAVQTLRAAGYSDEVIHVMACWDFEEAIERRQQQNLFSKLLTYLYSFLDEDTNGAYLREAQRKHHILAVRLTSSEQIRQVHNLLVAHHAHLIKYIDTWTVTHLSPCAQY